MNFLSDESDDIKALAHGPLRMYKSYKKYLINGFRFHTRDVEARRKTQNSGVIMIAETQSFASSRDSNPVAGDVTYYGILKDIIELEYLFGRRIVLFECDWIANSGKKKDNDSMLVNLDRLKRDEDHFILASQAEHVMYLQDLKHKGWHVAIKIVPRDFYDCDVRSSGEDIEPYLQSAVFDSTNLQDNDQQPDLVWPDTEPIYVDTPFEEVQAGDAEYYEYNSDEEEELDLLF